MIVTMLMVLITAAFGQSVRTPANPDGVYEINLDKGSRCLGSENCLILGNETGGLLAFWFPGEGVPDLTHTVNRDGTERPIVAYLGKNYVVGLLPDGTEIVRGFAVATLRPGERGTVKTDDGNVDVKARRLNGSFEFIKTVYDEALGMKVRAYLGAHSLEQTCSTLSAVLNRENRIIYENDDCTSSR